MPVCAHGSVKRPSLGVRVPPLPVLVFAAALATVVLTSSDRPAWAGSSFDVGSFTKSTTTTGLPVSQIVLAFLLRRAAGVIGSRGGTVDASLDWDAVRLIVKESSKADGCCGADLG